MIPEFPLPEDVDLLHQKPVFSIYSADALLPAALSSSHCQLAIRNPIDLKSPLLQAKSGHLRKSSWAPQASAAVASSTASCLSVISAQLSKSLPILSTL